MTEYQSRVCPSCGGASVDSKSTVRRSAPAETLEFPVVRDNWVGFRNDQIFFTYERCATCGLLYAPNYLASNQLDELYAEMPDNSAGETYGALERTQASYARVAVKFAPTETRWLDVGADIGLFAEALQRISVSSEMDVDAVEPNIAVHDQLSKRVKRGQIYTSIEQAANKSYGGVAAIHVLDHLPELTEFLGEVKRVLCPGGAVVIVVHNERSVLRKFMGRRWPPFCLQHPQLFSPKSIETVLKNYGFVDIQCSRSTNYFTLRHIAEVALKILRAPERISRLVPPVTVGLQLGNLIVVGRVPRAGGDLQ